MKTAHSLLLGAPDGRCGLVLVILQEKPARSQGFPSSKLPKEALLLHTHHRRRHHHYTYTFLILSLTLTRSPCLYDGRVVRREGETHQTSKSRLSRFNFPLSLSLSLATIISFVNCAFSLRD